MRRTCRGMLGDGLKKHSSSLWPGKAAQGQLCGGGRGREPDTCLQQKAGEQEPRTSSIRKGTQESAILIFLYNDYLEEKPFFI